MTALAVLLGAGVGAAARYLLDQMVQSRHPGVFPWGTLLINTTGSAVLGLLLAAAAHGRASHLLVAALGTGLCGGFTTFSTFAYETVRLSEDGAQAAAGLNVAVSLVAGLAAAALGWYVGVAAWGS